MWVFSTYPQLSLEPSALTFPVVWWSPSTFQACPTGPLSTWELPGKNKRTNVHRQRQTPVWWTFDAGTMYSRIPLYNRHTSIKRGHNNIGHGQATNVIGGLCISYVTCAQWNVKLRPLVKTLPASTYATSIRRNCVSPKIYSEMFRKKTLVLVHSER